MSGINNILRKMCQPTESRGVNTDLNINLRVRPAVASTLLADPHYEGVATEDLIELASGKIKGVTDRCTAIAVLRGVN
jgi:hypothetical protein